MNHKAKFIYDWWINRPWRLVQPNLREIDVRDIDAERFVADLLEYKATVVMLSTSGIVANYATRLPYHFLNPYLRGNSFHKIVKACHTAGIKVIARVDFSKVRKVIFDKNPEWAFVNGYGEILEYNGDVHVCFNSLYQQELSLEIIKETIEMLDVDGMYFNMSGYGNYYTYSGTSYSHCQCQSCQTRFANIFGEPLPDDIGLGSAGFKKYQQFKALTIEQYREKVYRLVNDLKPGFCIANYFEFNRGFIRNEASTAFGRPMGRAVASMSTIEAGRAIGPYIASMSTKEARTIYPNMPSSTTTVEFMDFSCRHTAVSPFLQERRLLQSIANGGGLDYYIMGRLDNHEDRSGFEIVKSVFRYHAAHESEYLNLESVAEIALMQNEDKLFKSFVSEDFEGWFRFLIENHFLFDVLPNRKSVSMLLDKYKVIILPDKLAISAELAKELDAFVAAGGTVIAAFQSAFNKEDAGFGKEPILRSMGIRSVKEICHSMTSSYFKFNTKEGFPRFKNTDLIYLRGSYIYAEYEETAERWMNLIPPHMFGPPERCYYTKVLDDPGFTINSYGKGRGVYIPWCPGEMFCLDGHTNTIDFIRDLIEHVLGINSVSGNLSRMVEVYLQKKMDEPAMLLHLINGTGYYGNTFYEPVILSDIKVSLVSVGTPKSVKSLVNGMEYRFNAKDGKLLINIDRLGHFDAIKIIY